MRWPAQGIESRELQKAQACEGLKQKPRPEAIGLVRHDGDVRTWDNGGEKGRKGDGLVGPCPMTECGCSLPS